MKKNEQGVLTVEASVVLVVFILFILFLFNFAGAYRAQSIVSHAAIEATDAVALESYLREVACEADTQDVLYLASKLGGSATMSADSLESLRTADIPRLVREKFVAAIAGSEADADAKLKALGVKDGLSGIDFSQCYADTQSDNIVAYLSYTIELDIAVFGTQEIQVTKAAKAKTFGDILYSVTTSSNNPDWGSTSGDNRVTQGAWVEITATPKFGYRFVKWDDGNTDNPRRVRVSDVSKYQAIFEPTNMGINLYLKKTSSDTRFQWDEEQEYGTVTGAGNYAYMETATISATSKEHYTFIGWDDNGDGQVDSTENPRAVVVDETHNITAVYQAAIYTVTVRAEAADSSFANENYGSAWIRNGNELVTSIALEYRSQITLTATPETNFRFREWNTHDSNSELTVEVLGDAAYTAIFERNTCQVQFYVDDVLYNTQEVVIGSSIEGSKGTTGAVMPIDPQLDKQCFNGWRWNNQKFTGRTQIPKSSSTIRVDAQFAAPSITLLGGLTGQNTTTFTVETIPENAKVNWTSSDSTIAFVNNQGKVEAKKPGTITVTAYFELDGQRYEDSVSLRVLETTYSLGYCYNMGNKTRYYTNEHQDLNKVWKYGVWFPGTNHHCYTLPNTQYASKGSYTESQLKELERNGKTCDSGSYCRGIKYAGWNKSSETAYIISNGSGEALYFIREKFGPGGFYIYSIEHKN